MERFVCRNCATSYALADGAWRCLCGGLFDLEMDIPKDAFSELATLPFSLWRYHRALPFSPSATSWQDVTLGEGATPIVTEPDGLVLKLDFLMPTLSFKDRGSVVLVSKAVELGVDRVVADSSGNAGTSIAAYASRAGIGAEIFVPESTSEKKVAQLRGYGATVRQVRGSRADAARAAIELVESGGAFYASHIFNPLFHHGTKTFAFELYEQLGGNLPEAILLPAGNGTLLIGAAIGFRELIATGNLDHMPRLVAVQAERCAPLANAHSRHATAGLPTAPGRATLHTVAEGIAIAEPPRLAQMLEIIEDSGGSVRTVSEDAILDARAALARRGIDVEPTAATGYAAWREWSQESRPSSAVVALTGAGLKSPASA